MSRLTLALMLWLSSTAIASADTLKLYTSQPNEDAQKTVKAFEAANPGTKVDWVRDGTTQLMTRMAAEMAAGAGQPDVLLYSADGFYYSTKLITTGIAYNTAVTMVPTSWADLEKPEYKGLIASPSPLYSGAALIHLAAVTNDPALGWKHYEALAANETRADGGNGGVFKAVASGEKPYGILVDYMALRAKADGSPVGFVFPSEGVTYVTEPVAIIKGAANMEGAKKFVDFVLSYDGQKLVVDMGYIPARNGLASPEGFPARDSLKLIKFDAAKALADTDANKARFSKIFGVQ
jgi:iron(III) transport system substrate-binding protein